jgi:hypothetical protein
VVDEECDCCKPAGVDQAADDNSDRMAGMTTLRIHEGLDAWNATVREARGLRRVDWFSPLQNADEIRPATCEQGKALSAGHPNG